jgi:hypothetical protein
MEDHLIHTGNCKHCGSETELDIYLSIRLNYLYKNLQEVTIYSSKYRVHF